MGIHAGYAQYEVVFGDWNANAAKVRQCVAKAASADLLVLPELALTGYDFLDQDEVKSFSEPFGEGPTAALLRELAAQHATTLVLGYPERTENGCYNASMLAMPDGTLHNYRKIHLFDREMGLFLPGNRPPSVFETPAGRVGVMICFDWFFPETARCLALAGAQIIAHPANLVLPWSRRAMPVRALENHVFTITASRIGVENRAGRSLTFAGDSQVITPKGEVIAQAPTNAEDTRIVEISPTEADSKHLNVNNDLFADRKPECYGRITQPRTDGDA